MDYELWIMNWMGSVKGYVLKAILLLSMGSATLAATAQTITLQSATQSKQQTVEDIEGQTQYKFFFESVAFKPQTVVNFGRTQLPLEYILVRMAEGTGLTTKIDGQHIVYHRPGKKTNTSVAAATSNPGKAEATSAVPLLSQGNGDKPSAGTTEKTTKTTAYFRPNTFDHTVRAFSEEAKNDYTYVPSAEINRAYLPRVAIKTNLLVWATATSNVAVEFALAKKWTLDLSAGYNPFRLQKGGINKVGFFQPELRYWFCRRFERHALGLHGIYAKFNIGEVDFLTTTFENHLYDGWGAGAGISYIYHLPMGQRWAWEFTLGAGYMYLEYDKYRCHECDEFVAKKNRHYFGPTKAGVSLIFMIK